MLTTLSLVLCVGTAVLWVRSYWVWDDLTLPLTSRHDVFIASDTGRVTLGYLVDVPLEIGDVGFSSEEGDIGT